MEQLADQDDRGGASRRSRKDIEGRDFICGCGKKYLSYPALYTHIKTKHDGRQPEGTQKTSSGVVTKRKSKIEDQFLTQIQSLVQKQDLKLLEVADLSLQGSTPLHSRIKKQLLPKQTYEAYQNLTKQNNWIKLTKQFSLDAVLAVYLIGVGQHVVQKLHEQYCLFAKLLRECYYTLGQQVYQKCFSKKQGGLGFIATFNVQKVKYLPIICDFFCRFFLPYDYKDVNRNLMQLLIYDFCDWLKKMRLTFIQVSLNKQYKLQKPLELVSRAPKRQKPSSNDKQNERQQIWLYSHGSNQNKQFNDMDDIQNDKKQLQDEQNKPRDYQIQGKGEFQNQENGKQQQCNNDNNDVLQDKLEEGATPVKNQSEIVQNNVEQSVNRQTSDRDGNWSLQPQPASESVSEQIRQVQQQIKQQELQQLQKRFQNDNQQNQAKSLNQEPKQQNLE